MTWMSAEGWVADAAESLRNAGVMRLSVDGVDPRLLRQSVADLLLQSNAFDADEVAREFSAVGSQVRIGAEPNVPSPDPSADAVVLYVLLKTTASEWAASQLLGAAVVEVLTFFPNQGFLRELGWRPPRLPLTQRGALRRVTDLLKRLGEAIGA